MPARSTGCHTCRKRKIRCDETRPGCNRCKTHGVPCPGYRLPAPGQVAFQDQTRWTVVNAHKAYKTKVPISFPQPRPPTPDSDSYEGEESIRKDSLQSSTSSSSSSSISPGQFQQDFWPLQFLYPDPIPLPSPSAQRALVYSSFMDTYLPKRMGQSDMHFSFLQHLITTPQIRPEVTDGLDALSMVQVGSLYNDRNLLRQAVKAYSRCLGGLVRVLSGAEGENVIRDDYILATVSLLANCEFYEEIAEVGDGWSKHVQGSQQLLAIRGPDSMNTHLALLLYSSLRHATLSHSLIQRKACFLGTPEWRAVAWRTPTIDAATLLYDSALQVPALLERFDALNRDSSTFLAEAEDVLRDAAHLTRNLQGWYDDYQVSSRFRHPRDESLFWSTKIANFPTFTTLCLDRTVEEAYMFPSYMVAFLLSRYWNVMHILRTSVRQLHLRRHEVSRDWFPSPEEIVTENELKGYVMDLVRCFPYFCEPVSAATGRISILLPLRSAAFYFMEVGNWPMLRWIAAMREGVFTSFRVPTVRPSILNAG